MTLKDQKCAFLYEECNYMGEAVEICGKNDEVDPDFLVKSIKLPPRQKVKIYKENKF